MIERFFGPCYVRTSRLAAACAAICISSITAGQSDASIGTVLVTKGQVEARAADGTLRLLARSSPIFEADIILVGGGAQAQVRMVDNALLSFKSDTEFSFDTYRFDANPATPDSALMSMVRGGFLTISGSIGDADADDYRIDTPFASIGIRGTTHEALIAGDILYTGVSDGGTTISANSSALDTGLDADYDFSQTRAGQTPQGLLERPEILGQISISASVLRAAGDQASDTPAAPTQPRTASTTESTQSANDPPDAAALATLGANSSSSRAPLAALNERTASFDSPQTGADSNAALNPAPIAGRVSGAEVNPALSSRTASELVASPPSTAPGTSIDNGTTPDVATPDANDENAPAGASNPGNGGTNPSAGDGTPNTGANNPAAGSGSPISGGDSADAGNENPGPGDSNANAGSGNSNAGGNNNPNAGSGNSNAGGNSNPNAGSGNSNAGGNSNPNAGSGNSNAGGNSNPNAGSGNSNAGGNSNPNAGSGNSNAGGNGKGNAKPLLVGELAELQMGWGAWANSSREAAAQPPLATDLVDWHLLTPADMASMVGRLRYSANSSFAGTDIQGEQLANVAMAFDVNLGGGPGAISNGQLEIVDSSSNAWNVSFNGDLNGTFATMTGIEGLVGGTDPVTSGVIKGMFTGTGVPPDFVGSFFLQSGTDSVQGLTVMHPE